MATVLSDAALAALPSANAPFPPLTALAPNAIAASITLPVFDLTSAPLPIATARVVLLSVVALLPIAMAAFGIAPPT